MNIDDVVEVSVHYAEPHRHWWRQLRLPPGATVADALQASGFHAEHPAWQGYADVGIDGKVVPPETPLASNDRVEIYRPLTFDPMVSRRRRAAHRAKQEAGALQGRRGRATTV